MNSAVQFVNKGQILRNSNYLIITEQRVLYVRHVSAGRRKLILNTATTKLKSTMAARSKAWGLRPVACWDSRFESRRGNGCLSVVSVVCCTGRGLCQCFSTFVRPRPGKFFFHKTRGPVPTNLLVNTFPTFFKFIHVN